MYKPFAVHPRARRIVQLLVIIAITLAGYAGVALAPAGGSTASRVVPHTTLADTCIPGNGHC